MAESTPVSQEEVLAQLIVRGYEAGYTATPLRDFWGKLKSITGEMRQGQRGSYLVALYNNEEIEVIVSVEPYTSPIAQIEVPVSTKEGTRMGYLGASVDKIINAGLAPDVPQAQAKNFESLIGSKLHWQFTPGHMIRSQGDDGVWRDSPTNCWTITEIAGEGVAPATPTQATGVPPPPVVSATSEALRELDNKNILQWYQTVYNNPTVKADVPFLNTIIDGSFISSMETAGKITKDENGIYHVVA